MRFSGVVAFGGIGLFWVGLGVVRIIVILDHEAADKFSLAVGVLQVVVGLAFFLVVATCRRAYRLNDAFAVTPG